LSSYGAFAFGYWTDRRCANLLDGGAPFYGVYRTADDRFLAVGAIEPQFYREFLTRLGLDPENAASQFDRTQWSEMRARIAEIIVGRTRDAWCEAFEGSDACVVPVLSLVEAPEHPHLRERATFIAVEGVTQPSPAPRFSRTTCDTPSPPTRPGVHTRQILGEIGYLDSEIASLLANGAVAAPV